MSIGIALHKKGALTKNEYQYEVIGDVAGRMLVERMVDE